MFVRALVYAVVAGGFGGVLWILLITLAPPEEVFSPNWWIGAGIGIAVWTILGLIVGAFASPPRGNSGQHAQGPDLAVRKRPSAGRLLGSALYRTAIGLLMAFVVTSVFSLVAIGIGFALSDWLEQFRGSPTATVLLACVLGGLWGGLTGGIFGAWFAAAGTPGRRHRIDIYAMWSSALGIGLGMDLAAIIALAQESPVPRRHTEMIVGLLIGSGCVAGLLAGVFIGIWSKVKKDLDVRRLVTKSQAVPDAS